MRKDYRFVLFYFSRERKGYDSKLGKERKERWGGWRNEKQGVQCSGFLWRRGGEALVNVNISVGCKYRSLESLVDCVFEKAKIN